MSWQMFGFSVVVKAGCTFWIFGIFTRGQRWAASADPGRTSHAPPPAAAWMNSRRRRYSFLSVISDDLMSDCFFTSMETPICNYRTSGLGYSRTDNGGCHGQNCPAIVREPRPDRARLSHGSIRHLHDQSCLVALPPREIP